MTDELTPKAYLSEKQIEEFNSNPGLVITCDYLPVNPNNVQLSSWAEANEAGYFPPDFSNCELAVINPNGDHNDGVMNYSLVPLMVHESFKEE